MANNTIKQSSYDVTITLDKPFSETELTGFTHIIPLTQSRYTYLMQYVRAADAMRACLIGLKSKVSGATEDALQEVLDSYEMYENQVIHIFEQLLPAVFTGTQHSEAEA